MTDEPECDWPHDEHKWRSPYSVVGGCEENPGVWGHNGGLKFREVCQHCGVYRLTYTDNNRRGDDYECVEYERPDRDSLAYVEECADA